MQRTGRFVTIVGYYVFETVSELLITELTAEPEPSHCLLVGSAFGQNVFCFVQDKGSYGSRARKNHRPCWQVAVFGMHPPTCRFLLIQ